jgi:tRNA U34 5-carboxymethylaminomethyl modifying GTPase MnmE/TrmE
MGENLKKLGEDMVRKLEQNPAEEAINRMLQEAQSLLSQMAKTIQQFPKELPDDFVNQEALKNLDIGKADDILSQIQQAMKQGDTKKALALAKQYLEAAKKMAEQLSEAYDSYSDENSAEQLADEIEKRAEKLSEITKKQQELLAETQKMESQRLKEMLKEQEKLLETL